MKVILVFVSTLDGKITKWGNPHVKDWSSQKDQEYYKELWNHAWLQLGLSYCSGIVMPA
ncbi:hypothetical protein BH11BAC5_BH11BAC5_23810 [soil metagenome]